MASKLFTFKGGTAVGDYKDMTKDKGVEKASVPSLLYIPLDQHLGAAAEPVVKRGDTVKVGQLIGKHNGDISASVHSSVSGVVKSIEPYMGLDGKKVMTVIIENDGLDSWDESIKPRDLEDLSPEDIKNIVLEAGIVGMGGAAFPSHVKLSPPEDKEIEAIILNGAECEPYITSDYRLMLEEPEKIVAGLKLIMKAIGIDKGYIGIEANKPKAIEAMREAVKGSSIEIIRLKTKYPQGCEKLLVQAVLGKWVPARCLPADAGAVVYNVATAAWIYDAVKEGRPFIERIVTLTGGGLKEPKNLMVRIGSLYKDLIEDCGGLTGPIKKVIMGGPMMGLAQHTFDMPVIKGTTSVLFLTEDETKDEIVHPCIRCAKCVEHCPMNLLPLTLNLYADKGEYDSCEEYDALECIECGVCSYICPSNRPLAHSIRMAKHEINEKNKISSQ